MIPQEKLKKIKDKIENEENNPTEFHPYISTDDAEWLISRIEQLENALKILTAVNEMPGETFERLRLINVKNWSVHDLDNYALIARNALEEIS